VKQDHRPSGPGLPRFGPGWRTQNVCPEAKPGLEGWQRGELTWEEAMMEVVKSLFLAKEETQRRLDYTLSPSRAEPSVGR